MSDRETQPGSIIPGVDWESGVKRLCATPDSIGYLGKRDLVGLRGNWWDW